MSGRRRPLPRPMPIGWMTLVIAGVLYLAGSNIGSGWVIILTAAMAGGVLLDLVTVWRADRSTLTALTLPATAGTLEPPRAVLTVERRDHGSVLHVADGTDTCRGVVRGPGARLQAVVPAARGHHTDGRVSLRTIGTLGLARLVRTQHHEVDLWVRPSVLAADARIRALLGTSGEDASRARSTGQDEVRGVRGFEPGDPRRSVHWRATARHGALMVRQSEGPRGAHVRVAIAGGTWTPASLDLATTVTASLCSTAARLGHRAELAVDGGVRGWDDVTHHGLAMLPPAAGVPTRPLADVPAEGLRISPAGEGIVVEDPTSPPVHLTDVEEARRWLACA